MSINLGTKDLFPYLEDYRPVNIYKGENKIAGWKWMEQSGKELHFENTYNDFVYVEINGKSYQDGEPSPDNPADIHSLNDFDVVSQKSEGGTIDKINLLLSEPLRSVGDVHDRLFIDDDGLWKIERNVGHHIFTGLESGTEGTSSLWASFSVPNLKPSVTEAKTDDIITTHFPAESHSIYNNPDKTGWHTRANEGESLVFFNYAGKIGKELRAWFQEQYNLGKPVEAVYTLNEAFVEDLDKELQNKLNNLRSFRDSNYIYITGSIQPQLIGKLKVKE